jgi:hypothetical protein
MAESAALVEPASRIVVPDLQGKNGEPGFKSYCFRRLSRPEPAGTPCLTINLPAHGKMEFSRTEQ